MKKRKVIKSVALATALSLSISTGSLYLYNGLFRWNYNRNVRSNTYEYSSQLQTYNSFLEQYVQYINSLELSDIEIFVKVMKDIWADIDGYGKSDNLINGYFRLSFQEEGKGVCTSFADDFTVRMNAINPKYNARNLIVYMDDLNCEIEKIDIERNLLTENSITSSNSTFKKIYGNHMVSVVEIPEYKLTLIVDPTNLFIGQLKNGKIDIFNVKENFMDIRFNSSSHYTTKSYIELLNEYFVSFEKNLIEQEEIINLYGFDAQEEALAKVEEIDQEVKRKVFLRNK